MKKILTYMACLAVAFSEGGCNSRANDECDMAPLVSCSLLYSEDADIENCANEASDNACALSALSGETNPSESSGSYACTETSWTRAAEDAGFSTSYSSGLTSTSDIIFVDPSLDTSDLVDLLTDPQNSNVTYSIQTAVDLSDEGSTIVICPGSYAETVSIDSSAHDNITLTNIAEGDSDLAPFTIISAGGLGTPLTVEDAENVTIQGITLQDGLASYGGGIMAGSLRESENNANIVTISNSVIKNNTAILGGGIYLEGYVSILVENTSILSNSATSGGGLYLSASSTPKEFVCDNCVISENEAALAGTAAFVEGKDTLLLSDSAVQGNRTAVEGLDLQAIYLATDGNLEASDVDWGEEATENNGGDVFNYIEGYTYVTDGSTTVIRGDLLALIFLLNPYDDGSSAELETIVDELWDHFFNILLSPTSFDATDAEALNDTLDELETTLDSLGISDNDIDDAISELRADLSAFDNGDGIYDYSGIESISCNLDEDSTCTAD